MKQTLKKTLSIVLSMLLLLPAFSFVAGAYVEGTYDFNVPKAVAPITADGYVNELEWKDALHVSLAESAMQHPILDGNAKIGENSYLKMMWDDDYLYYAFKIDDPLLIANTQICLFGSDQDGFAGGPRMCIGYKTGKFFINDDTKHYDLKNVTIAGSTSDIGYVVEIMVPWSVFADMYAKGAISANYPGQTGTMIFQDIMIMQQTSDFTYNYWSRLSNSVNGDGSHIWLSGAAASRFTLVDQEAGHYFDPAVGPYSVPKAGTAPEIEGFADPDEWQNAANISLKSSDIIWTAEGSSLNDDGTFNTMWMTDGFYGVAYIPDSVYNDRDAFKLSIFENGEALTNRLQISFERTNTLSLYYGSDDDFSGLSDLIEYAVASDDESYVVEFFIPAEVITAVTGAEMVSGNKIYANVLISDFNAEDEYVVGYIGEGTSLDDAKDEYTFSNGAAGIAPTIPDYNQHEVGKATNPPKINGYINKEVNEWPEESFIGTLSTEHWGALQHQPEDYDFYADIYAMWDENYLYYALDINDPFLSDSERIRFDFFGTSYDANMGKDTFTVAIAPWTAYSSSPELNQESRLLLDLPEFVTVSVSRVNSSKYQFEIRIDWKLFETACNSGREMAGITYDFTGNYTGRPGTVFPLHINYMDTFNEEGETAWFLYYNGIEDTNPFYVMSMIPNDIDTWKLTTKIINNGIDEADGPKEREPENIYEIPRTTQAITPDGVLGDEWKNAQVLDFSPDSLFTVMDNNAGSLGAGSKAMLLWDDTYLYVGLDIKDSTNTGNYVGRGGSADGPVDFFTLNFFSSLASTSNSDSLVFNFYPKTSDYTYKQIPGYSGSFETNINGASAFFTYKNLPTYGSVAEGDGYNYTMEIAIPWSLFSKLSQNAVNIGKTFKNYPVPEAGTTFRMAAEYRDNDAEGNMTWYYHNYFKGVIDTAWPFSYNTMDVFKLIDSTELHEHSLVKVDAKDSTCTEMGNIEHYLCEGCGKMFANADATGLLYDEDVFLKTIDHNIICDYDENEHYDICTMCKEKFAGGEHEFGEWIIDKEADYGVEGQRHRECTVCEYVQNETIPALVGATIAIDNVEEVAIGDEFKTYIHLDENPGIVSIRFDIKYDMTKFELVSVKDLEALKGWTEPVDVISSPYRLRWCDPLSDDMMGATNNTTTENIVELTFRVLDDVEPGEYEIEVIPVEAYKTVDKMTGNEIHFAGSVAKINVVEGFIYGDVNDSKSVDEMDSVALARYLAGWNITINMKAANVQYDESGNVDERDAVKLARFLAGWNVVLGPEKS